MIAKKEKIDAKARDNVLAYLKLEPGRGKIDMNTIALIPKAFSGSGRIDYDAALKEVLMKGLKLGDM